MEYKEAQAKWQKQKETKYSDREIREFIARFSYDDAQTRIAYNEMIDTRIERAERSWK